MSYISNDFPRVDRHAGARPETARALTARWAQSGLLILLSDFAIAQLTANALYFLLYLYRPAIAELHLGTVTTVLVATSLVAANGWMGLYGCPSLGPVERFRRRILGALLMPWLALGLLSWIEAPSLPLLVFVCLVAVLVVPLGMVGASILQRIWPGTTSAATLLVGDPALANRFAAYFAARPELGLNPVGIVNDAPNEASSLPWLGRLGDLAQIAADMDVVAIVSSADLPAVEAVNLPVRRVVMLHAAGDSPAVTLSGRHLGADGIFEMNNPVPHGVAQQLKRLLELCIAVPALIVALPVMGMAALAIKLVSPGPVFYVQYRVGWRGERIAVHKLRSMYPDAERRLEQLLAEDPEARREWDRHMKLRRDPRVLPHIGGFIRKTSIDELPQLWDVVKGTIALVGPRPFPEYHIAKFPAEFQTLRASVKPGLTGLWQVSERSEADLLQQQTVDTFYIRNWSLWFDAYLVARTFGAVFLAHGAR